MRRNKVVILALVLVFALIFTACTARRPLQTPVQPRSNTTGLYNNGTGTGTSTGVGTTTGSRTSTGTGTGYGGYGNYGTTGTGTGYGGYGGYGTTGTGTGYGGYGGYGTTGTSTGYGGYGTTGTGRYYGGTGTVGNYGGLGTSNYGGGFTGMGNQSYNGYGGYGGYNNGMYGGYSGYGVDYRNVGGSNNSPNYGYSTGYFGTTQADGISKAVEQMVGINNAAVVVSGNTAYVGINTTGDLSGRNVSYGNSTDITAMKRAVAQRVRAADPTIQTVYVSTDTNFFNRIRNVGTGVRNGSPVGGFTGELSNLIRGLTPERQ